MRFIITFLAIYLLMPFFCFSQEKRPEYANIADRLLYQISNEIQKKFNVKQVGSGGGMCQCVRLLGLTFECHKLISQDGARAFIVPMLQLFLQRINENKEIRPFLQNYPFRIENIEISIFVYDNKGNDPLYPYIGMISCSNGKITYTAYNPDPEQARNKYKESYEEALNKLNSQKS
jgi:hypothetical protein